MTETEILDGVREVIGDLFGIDASDINIDTARESVEAWDSLQHVNVILDLENRFDVHLSETQIANIHGVRDIIEVIVREKQGTV